MGVLRTNRGVGGEWQLKRVSGSRQRLTVVNRDDNYVVRCLIETSQTESRPCLQSIAAALLSSSRVQEGRVGYLIDDNIANSYANKETIPSR